MVFYKNSFYNNFRLVPSLPSKNKNLALALENNNNQKKSPIKLSTESPSSLDFVN